MYEELDNATRYDGTISPKFLWGKTIYNTWLDNSDIILVIKEGYLKFRIKGTKITLEK